MTASAVSRQLDVIRVVCIYATDGPAYRLYRQSGTATVHGSHGEFLDQLADPTRYLTGGDEAAATRARERVIAVLIREHDSGRRWGIHVRTPKGSAHPGLFRRSGSAPAEIQEKELGEILDAVTPLVRDAIQEAVNDV